MNTTVTDTTTTTSDPSLPARLRERARARRRARAERRRLVAELASYRTPAERFELEAMLSRGSEREVEAIHHLLHAARRAA